MYSLTDSGVYGQELKLLGVEVVSLHFSKYNFLMKMFNLTQLLKEKNSDITQTWLYHADLIGGVCAKIAKKNKIIWCVRNSHLKFSNSKALTILIRLLCSMLSYFIPTKIIYNSKYSKNIHEKLGYSKSKSVLIYNGFDQNLFKRSDSKKNILKNNYGITQNSIVFGFVARYDKVKGYDLLFNTLKKYRANKDDFKLIMIGDGLDENNSELLSLISKNNLENNTILLGRQRNIPQILSIIDVILFTSYSESFPNVVAEAMLCKVPVIGNDVGDIKDIISNYGWVTESVSSNHILAKIFEFEKLINSDKNWKIFQNNCREHIIKNFDMLKMQKSFNKVWSA